MIALIFALLVGGQDCAVMSAVKQTREDAEIALAYDKLLLADLRIDETRLTSADTICQNLAATMQEGCEARLSEMKTIAQRAILTRWLGPNWLDRNLNQERPSEWLEDALRGLFERRQEIAIHSLAQLDILDGAIRAENRLLEQGCRA